MPILSASAVEVLEDIHDTEIPYFLDYMNHAAKDLRQMAAFKEVKKSPGDIQKELDKVRDVLDKVQDALDVLSPYAKMHIWKQSRETILECKCPEWLNAALSIPYEQETTHPDRVRLVQHARYIDTHFIQAQDVVDTKVILKGLVQFLIDTTGVKGTAKNVADEARAENIQMAKEK